MLGKGRAILGLSHQEPLDISGIFAQPEGEPGADQDPVEESEEEIDYSL